MSKKLFILEDSGVMRKSLLINADKPARSRGFIVSMATLSVLSLLIIWWARGEEGGVRPALAAPAFASAADKTVTTPAQQRIASEPFAAPTGTQPEEPEPAPSPLQLKAARLYEDARMAYLCARWAEESAALQARHANLALGSAEREALAADEAAAQQRAAETGADQWCPSRGSSDLVQAAAQMKEAARLGKPDARYEVALASMEVLERERKAQAAGAGQTATVHTEAEIKAVFDEVHSLAETGHRPAAFLLSAALTSGIGAPADPVLAAAWVLAAIHPPASTFNLDSVESAGPYAGASSSDQARIAESAHRLFDQCCRTIR